MRVYVGRAVPMKAAPPTKYVPKPDFGVRARFSPGTISIVGPLESTLVPARRSSPLTEGWFCKGMRVLSVFALGCIASACASTNPLAAHVDVSKQRSDGPQLASMQPVAPERGEPSTPEVGDDSAGGLLERAFAQFNSDDYSASAKTFEKSIATNNLNEAGRSLAYWHIYLAEKRMGHEDKSTDALASFTTVAQELMESRGASGDFIERFSLDARLSRARAILSATWAKRVPGYGRSASDAVPVFDQVEADYFAEIAPPCATAKRRQTDKHTVSQRSGNELQRVTIYCDGQKAGTDYYLEIVKADLP